LCQAAPYILMFCEPDVEQDDGTLIKGKTEVYRCTTPPPKVSDFLTILKYFTHGIPKMRAANTLRVLWHEMKKILKENNKLEAQAWSNLPHSKFKFKCRNIHKMEEWQCKNNWNGVQFASTEWRLGITSAMVAGEAALTGYDLSKIEGFDKTKVIGAIGWALIQQTLLGMMTTKDFETLGVQMYGTSFLSKKQTKMVTQFTWEVPNLENFT
jgi:hypothetical protein